jgi:transposase
MRYHRGDTRYQQSFLSINDQISNSNVVRVIEEICEEFCDDQTIEKGGSDTGRKAYHPADLLKILVYGYFNGVSSSRKLERETQRNLEVKWLISNLTPDHKTISDFRKDNPELVDGLFKYLITTFKEKGLVSGKSVGVDGTKIKAYARKEINIDTIHHKLEGIEQQVEKYLQDINTLDTAEDAVEELEKKKSALEAELEELTSKKKYYQHLASHLQSQDENRVCLTDRDSKLMRGRYGNYWGYNAQVAVDSEHHLITSVKVTNHQNDKGLLTPMLKASKEVTGQKPDESLADGGYYKIHEIEKLEQEGTTCYVAINRTPSQARDQANGLTFTYLPHQDIYQCSEGKPLVYTRKKIIDDRLVKVYKGTQCNCCAVQEKCTSADQRSVHRNDNQPWIDWFNEKMNSKTGKEKMVKRRSLVEHPFGTMKYHMGQIPLLLRGKKRVQTEMNLYAIGYNLKRYFNIEALKSKELEKISQRLAA